jgi:hypothetical protein
MTARDDYEHDVYEHDVCRYDGYGYDNYGHTYFVADRTSLGLVLGVLT